VLAPLVAVLLAPAAALWRHPTPAYVLALAGVAGGFVFSLLGLLHVLEVGRQTYRLGGWEPPIGVEYVLDPLSAFVATVVSGLAFIALVYSHQTLLFEVPGKLAAYYGVALMLVLGLLGIVLTGDLFNLYVFLEIASIASYGLVAIGAKQAPFAAFRYLLLGTLGGNFYLLGIGFLYFSTGTLNMAHMAELLAETETTRAVVVGVSFIAIGLGLKMALFPLHMWLPDAYTAASSASIALISPIVTKVAAYALVRILFTVLQPDLVVQELPITTLIGWLAAIGVIWGSVMAIAQTDFRRMLAYSSVGQVSYIGLGIGLANPLALVGALLQILSHGAGKACLFLIAGGIRRRAGTDRIADFAGISRLMPWTMLALVVAALSMIGLPPTSGFFVKWYLVLGSVEAGNWAFVVVIVVSGLLNAVYFFRVLEQVYLVTPESLRVCRLTGRELPWSMLLPILALAIITLAAGLLSFVLVESVLQPAVPPGL
jgi:multicomponent Na+:H+ antiporter subunit D